MSANTCGPIDLVFLQDLSGSYADDLPILKAQIPNVIAALDGAGADADFAVASFIDKPTGAFGAAGDYVYQTHLGISSDNASVISAINALGTRSGADAEEAQLEGLLQTALRLGELGYRTGSTKVVMLSTDAGYHEAGDFAAAGANNLDAVLDGTPPGTGEDYPTVDALRAALVAADIFPVFSVTAAVRPTYEGLVAQLGFGAVVTMTSNSTNFSDAVRTAIASACGTITHPGTDGNDVIEGTEDDDGCFGGLGDDDISGLGGDDLIDGGAGDDTCRGGSGFDDLHGGTGNDDLYGEDDDDRLTGGLGDDTMTGGAGADSFAINAGDGIDTITDFEDGIDRIDLSGMDRTAAARAVLEAIAHTPATGPAGTKLVFADGSSVTVLGLARADFDLADVILADGNSAPIAADDAAITTAVAPVTIAVLANDMDVEGSPLSLVSVGGAAHGTTLANADGTITYTAYPGFAGVETFTYSVSDGTRTSTAQVRVTVERQTEGGPGADTLYGDETAETLSGLGGDDYIDARGGDDIVDGGTGDDTLLGGWGRDTILGGDGDDTIVGGPAFAPDLPDDDTIDAGAGADTVDGGAGDDIINGGTGDDTLRGNADDDKIDGGAGRDLVEGGAGNDELQGGAGDDTLDGGTGDDQMDGGAGNDTYLIGPGAGYDIIEEDAKPSTSFDTVLFAAGVTYDGLSFLDDNGNLVITHAFGTLELAGQLDGDPWKQVEKLAFADGSSYDLIAGLFDDGTATGGGGTDAGETLTGTDAGETLDAMGGDDTVNAGGGDDILIGGAGDDLLRGEGGSDTYRFATGFGQDRVEEGADGADDVIHLPDALARDIRLSTTAAGDLVIDVAGGTDRITIAGHLSAPGIERILFGDGETMDLTGGLDLDGTRRVDTLYGTGFDDRIYSKAAADTVFGGLGDDVINSSGGDDVIWGDDAAATDPAGGDDTIRAGEGDDIAHGGAGRDKIYGYGGMDVLFGDEGRDSLLGGLGDDILAGGADDDRLLGGGGADTFVFVDDGSRDLVLDFETGVDVLDLTAFGITRDALSIHTTGGADQHVVIDAGSSHIVLRDMLLSDLDLATDLLMAGDAIL